MERGTQERQKKSITKGHKVSLNGVGYVHYLDGSDGFTNICKTDQIIYINIGSLFYANHTSAIFKSSWDNRQNLNIYCVSDNTVTMVNF